MFTHGIRVSNNPMQLFNLSFVTVHVIHMKVHINCLYSFTWEEMTNDFVSKVNETVLKQIVILSELFYFQYIHVAVLFVCLINNNINVFIKLNWPSFKITRKQFLFRFMYYKLRLFDELVDKCNTFQMVTHTLLQIRWASTLYLHHHQYACVCSSVTGHFLRVILFSHMHSTAWPSEGKIMSTWTFCQMSNE